MADTKSTTPTYDRLTPKQQRWIDAMTRGDVNPTEAARLAGYGTEGASRDQIDNACRYSGWKNAHNPEIQEAMRERAGALLYSGALLAASVLREIASDPTHKDRLKAARELLGHNGYQVIARQEIAVTHEVKDANTLAAEAVEMCRKLGLDPRQFLGANGIVVDAEFKVIEDKREPVQSTVGLEDLL